ncbi:MAG: hypothetical protein M1831_003054 [Alyxoria varia]|nr:MAG: hypothetical protein M1831_003054 [Alyxoria varia]
MNGSPSSPFIKNEPDDYRFDPNRFMKDVNGNNFSQSAGQSFGPWQGSHVDPVDLAMNGNASSPQPNFSTSPQNLHNNFMSSNTAITDDDLLDTFETSPGPNNQDFNMNSNNANNQPSFQNNQGMSSGFQQVPGPTSHPNFNGYSNTPDGAPIQSPFDHGFDYNQWQATQSNTPIANHTTRAMSGSGMRPTDGPGSMSRSPMTPGMGNLQISSEGGSFPGQPINTRTGHRPQQHSMSSQWDSSIGSAYSHFDSPLSSPNGGPLHPQISEVLKGHSASPTGTRTSSKPTSSAEIKKAKRRASHNEVERRRRNHINDQIANLSRLVPQHRLDDDAIRRALNSNSSLPPSIAGSGVSPPQATSLLAGGTGRRAAGTISQGLPVDEKDKNPAKGDVLNGAVGWVQDLMWMINKLTEREKILTETIQSMGGQSSLSVSEEESRMLTEVSGAFAKSGVSELSYSRAHGSNLYVPGFTDHAGAPVQTQSSTSVTPANFSLESTAQMNGSSNPPGSHHFWGFPGDTGMRSSADLKEEDEFDLEMN